MFSLMVRGKRCFVCHKRYLWHTPWRWHRCLRTPLNIIVEQEDHEAVA